MQARKMKTVITLLLCFVITSSNVLAQQAKKNNVNKKDDKSIPAWNKDVRVSPKASVMQTIGITDVAITYSSPGVKGRKIWGSLVPFDKVWRAGANEATIITFSTDVWIEGKKLSAGSYGLFVIPREKDWTVIFNKISNQWGAFEYNESQDVLRVNVTPQQGNFHEWLNYTFSDMNVKTHGKNSAVVNLNWEKYKIPFKIETDVK